MKKLIAIIFTACLILIKSTTTITAAEYQCGETYTDSLYIKNECNCDNVDSISIVGGALNYCCGWYEDGVCYAALPTDTPTPTDNEAIVIEEVTSETLDSLNPLKQFSNNPDRTEQFSTPGGIISVVLDFAFPIAGIILFIMLIIAGFRMLVGATDSKSADEAKQMATSAVIGFVILFAAYWIAQLLQLVFGINILGN